MGLNDMKVEGYESDAQAEVEHEKEVEEEAVVEGAVADS